MVFELLGSWYETVGRDGLRDELGRLRDAWASRAAPREAVPVPAPRLS
jgi:hypothetical protein